MNLFFIMAGVGIASLLIFGYKGFIEFYRSSDYVGWKSIILNAIGYSIFCGLVSAFVTGVLCTIFSMIFSAAVTHEETTWRPIEQAEGHALVETVDGDYGKRFSYYLDDGGGILTNYSMDADMVKVSSSTTETPKIKFYKDCPNYPEWTFFPECHQPDRAEITIPPQ